MALPFVKWNSCYVMHMCRSVLCNEMLLRYARAMPCFIKWMKQESVYVDMMQHKHVSYAYHISTLHALLDNQG